MVKLVGPDHTPHHHVSPPTSHHPQGRGWVPGDGVRPHRFPRRRNQPPPQRGVGGSLAQMTWQGAPPPRTPRKRDGGGGAAGHTEEVAAKEVCSPTTSWMPRGGTGEAATPWEGGALRDAESK